MDDRTDAITQVAQQTELSVGQHRDGFAGERQPWLCLQQYGKLTTDICGDAAGSCQYVFTLSAASIHQHERLSTPRFDLAVDTSLPPCALDQRGGR